MILKFNQAYTSKGTILETIQRIVTFSNFRKFEKVTIRWIVLFTLRKTPFTNLSNPIHAHTMHTKKLMCFFLVYEPYIMWCQRKAATRQVSYN